MTALSLQRVQQLSAKQVIVNICLTLLQHCFLTHFNLRLTSVKGSPVAAKVLTSYVLFRGCFEVQWASKQPVKERTIIWKKKLIKRNIRK